MDNKEFRKEIDSRMKAMKLSLCLVAATGNKEQKDIANCIIKSDEISNRISNLIEIALKNNYRIKSVLEYLQMLESGIELFTESYIKAFAEEQE